MGDQKQNDFVVAVIGAGPAGIFASRQLALEGVQVVLFNRDVKPGGLAEYGIYYDKYKMKEGLRRQFRQILDLPGIHYCGNLTIGENGDLSLDELKEIGFGALLVTAGAQGTKWLGLPGEDMKGVYHAKDLVYHYNKLPPYSTREFRVRGKVAIIGVGNVSMDIAHWVIRDLKVDDVVLVARRGPAEVKFTRQEMEYVISNLDLEALDAEMERIRSRMEEIGQDVEAARKNLLSAMPKALPPVSKTRFHFDFLASPTKLMGDDAGWVTGLEVEDTYLVLKDGDTKARSLETRRIIDVDSVVFCIGDRVDEDFGLPVQWNEFVKNPDPRYAVNGISYEAFDPQTNQPIEGVFMAGWSREASSGLVGVARKDGEDGAQAVLQYLRTAQPRISNERLFSHLEQVLMASGKRIVSMEDVKKLELVEQAEARQLSIQELKLSTNEEMLAVIERK